MYSSDVAKPRFTMVYEYSSRNALFNARMLKFTGERLHWLINAPEKTVFQNKKDLSFNHYAYVVNYCAIKSASKKLQDYHDFDVVSYISVITRDLKVWRNHLVKRSARFPDLKPVFLYEDLVKSYTSSKSGQCCCCSIWRHMIYLDLFSVMSIILVQYNNILYEEKRQFQAQDNCESYFSLRSLSKKLQHLKVKSIFSLFKLTSQKHI